MAGMKPFTVTRDESRDGQVLVVEGELDMATAPVLERYLKPLVGEVILECAALTFIDSRGLSLFVETHRRLCERGGRLVLAHLAPNCRRLIELMNLEKVFVLAG
jgi:anti-anti-sigma factor